MTTITLNTMKENLKLIGQIIGGIILIPFILVTLVGSFKTCGGTLHNVEEEKRIEQQPALLHIFPHATRAGIEEVKQWFADDKDNEED